MLAANHRLRIDPAPFRPQPITSSMDKRTIRFELERRACQSLREVLQLKLQQRRTREELVSQGIMPPLKVPVAFHEQRQRLERARTEDYLKRKIKSRPERAELVRMHILEESSTEPSLQAKQLLLKRARLADNLNDKLSQRPGPIELVHKNILPVHCSVKQAIIETDDNLSFDEDSSDGLSPELPVGQDTPLGLDPLSPPPDPLEERAGAPSPTQFLNQVPPLLLPPVTGPSSSSKLTNGTTASTGQRPALGQIKSTSKSSSERPPQRSKKPKDNKPKVKKLKYHQYIPPDQKADREPPPQLDSSYAKILQQQQLFLQLQIINQQQHYNYHTILPAPPKPQADQLSLPPSSSSSSTNTTSGPSPSRPAPAPSAAPSSRGALSRQDSNPIGGSKPITLPANLDEMKVAELKAELKLRSLPVSGTKNDLLERLKNYQELLVCSASGPTAGGAGGPGAGAGGASSKTRSTSSKQQQQQQHQQQQQYQAQPQQNSSLAHLSGDDGMFARVLQHVMTFDTTSSSPPVSPAFSDRSPTAMSPDNSCHDDAFGEMMISPLHPSPPSQHLTPSTTIKEESPTSCQFASQPSLQKQAHHRSLPLTADIAATAPPVDKDQMLQEKDKQIEELTRMLRQKQRLVETLRGQLEQGKRGGGATVKQEVVDTDDDSNRSAPTVPDALGALRFRPQPQEALQPTPQVQLRIKPEQSNVRPRLPQQPEQHQQPLRMQQPVRERPPAQQQALQQLLLEQQRNVQNHLRNQQDLQNLQHPQNLQKRSQQRKKKSHKQQLKQQQQLNGNHFLITLTNQTTDSPGSGMSLYKPTNNIKLQSGLDLMTDQSQQGVALPLSAPPSLRPFFLDEDDSAPSVNDALSSPSEMDHGSSQHMDNLFDILLQTGEISSSFKPSPDPTLARLRPNTPSASLPPSPLQLDLSPLTPSEPDTPQPSLVPRATATDEEEEEDAAGNGRLEDFLESTTGKPLPGAEPGGPLTLIDGLHSQLLSPSGLLNHPPSPMDTFELGGFGGPQHPDLDFAEPALDSMDWLDLGMGEEEEEEEEEGGEGGGGGGGGGGEGCEESTSLAPLAPPTPPCVFSADFLDGSDLQLHWDSCL
ncbi:myocardin-related transcription factor A-like [Aplochiton taeniatus]